MKTAFICFYLLGIGCTFGQDTSTQVKEQREYKVSIINNDTSLKINTILKYDSFGNTIEELYFDNIFNFSANKTYKYKTIYTYDEMNRVTSKLYFHNGSEIPSDTTLYYYKCNSERLIICDSLRTSDTSGTLFFYKYDNSKNRIQKTIRHFKDNYYILPIGIMDKNIKYIYDEFSNVTTIDYTGLGLDKKEHFTYDSIGNCISFNYEGSFGCTVGAVDHYTCEYDKSSNLIEKVCFLGCSATISKYYYSDNLLIKRVVLISESNYKTLYIYEYEFY